MTGYLGPFLLVLFAIAMWLTALYAVDQRYRRKDRHEVYVWMLVLFGCSVLGSLCALTLIHGPSMGLGRWLLFLGGGIALYVATAFAARYLLARMWNGGVDIT